MTVLSLAAFLFKAVNFLKTTTEVLERFADVLERGTTVSETLGEHVNTISDAFALGYNNLSPLQQNAVFFTAIGTSLLAFVFTAPQIARLLLGSDPILEFIPLPSAEFELADDHQAEEFVDDDVKPQLAAEPSQRTLPCVSPHTDAELGHAPQDTPATVKTKADLARKAQKKWATTTFSERCTVLRVLRDYLLNHQIELCGVSRLDTGKTMLDASLGEILTTLEKIRWLMAEGEKVLKPSRRTVGPMSSHKLAEVTYEPLGVIGAIAPWNYPLHNFFNPVLAALFSGNAAIVKPSEYTVYSSLHVCRLMRRALTVCGHDPELVQLLVGGADVGSAMVTTADVDKLFFTGSTKVGKLVSVAAAERLLPVVLELGGKDPFIICETANLPHAVSLCMRGVFQNAGQNCIGVERVFVHQKAYAKFVEMAQKEVEKLRLGIDVGAMTMGEGAIESVLKLVKNAKDNGAKVVLGGKRGKVGGKGTFLEPTLVVGVKPNMKIAKEEVFGPVMSVFVWETEEELLDMVNECKFGLGSSVFSGDKKQAARIVAGLRVGMSNVNDFGINYLCQSMPFGGTKESGSDRFAGVEGLRGCCLAKSTTRDRYPLIKTVLPRNLKYPISRNSFSLTLELNKLVYMPGVLAKIDSFRSVVISLAKKNYVPRETRIDMSEYE